MNALRSWVSSQLRRACGGEGLGMMKVIYSGVGAVVGLLFAGIVAAVVYLMLPTEPCSLFHAAQCRVLSGRQYATFDEFLSSQPASLMYGLGLVGGTIFGARSG
jgi:hypothetical protein